MTRQAILLPYCCDQNGPSVPLKFIVDIPDDVTARDKLLRELFIAHVMCEADAVDVDIDDTAGGYGDIVLSYNDVFLYVTYIEEANPAIKWNVTGYDESMTALVNTMRSVKW